jgi:AcrR family transcriptional regulator
VPPLKISRDEAILRASDVFRRYGYEGTTLTLLSEATGLGKASLYHHFPGGKEELAREVLRAVSGLIAEDVLVPLAGEGSPRERLEAWARGVGRIYDGGKKSCLLGAMVLSGGSELFRAEVSAAFHAWLDALTGVLVEARVPREAARLRAEAAVERIQGALILSRGLGQPGRFKRLVAELPESLLRG